MLYDNAQLALVYLHAWQITREPFFKRVVIETLDFVARELTHSDGGFYSSLDADSEGEEGKFYVWTKSEIQEAITNNSDFEFFSAAYGITEKGNWEGKTVLQRALDDAFSPPVSSWTKKRLLLNWLIAIPSFYLRTLNASAPTLTIKY